MTTTQAPKKQGVKKHHHMVPEFYLDRFSVEGLIARVDRETLQRKDLPPGQCAVRNHFYTVNLADGSRSARVEDALGDVEGRAASVLRNLDRGIFPETEDREWFCFFVALQLLRGEDTRAEIDSFRDHLAGLDIRRIPRETVRGLILARGEEDPPPEKIDAEYVDLERFASAEVEQNAYIEATLLVARQMLPSLTFRSWCLFTVEHPMFLTSDNPVIVHSLSQPDVIRQGVRSADVVALTIDPRKAIALMNPLGAPPDGTIAIGTAALVEDFNRMIAMQSWKWIFHHPSSPFDLSKSPYGLK